MQEHYDHRGNVHDAAVPRRLAHRVRQDLPKSGECLVDVLSGTDGDRRYGHGIFQYEAPATDPGHAFAHGGVGVGVAGTGDRHQPGHLRVGDRREQCREARNDERDPDGRTGQRDGFAEDDQNAGAERGSDADHGQLQDAETADQGRAAFAASGFPGHLRDGLPAQQLGAEAKPGQACRGWVLGVHRHSHR